MATGITLATQGIWLCKSDLEDATSVTMVQTIFDDDQTGSPNTRAIASVIRRAEMQVLSYLSEYGPPPLPDSVVADLAKDDFLKECAIEFAVAYMFDKHPEYVRANRQEDVAKRIKSAEEMMARVLDARQRPPTVPDKPANVGGVSVDNGPRLYADNADGSRNSGDF